MSAVDAKLGASREELDSCICIAQQEITSLQANPVKIGTPNVTSVQAQRVNSVGVRSTFVPSKVSVTGSYDHATGQGVLKPKERGELSANFLDAVLLTVDEKSTTQKKYTLNRRLVFVRKTGGEVCWELREHIKHLDTEAVSFEGKARKERVEEVR